MAEIEIAAGQVKELRTKTGAGMMDCKRALQECSGDFDQAVKALREKGLASAKKRQEKTADQGIIESYIHLGRQIGALVELNCETDFVARNEQFGELAHFIALQIAAVNPKYLDRESVPTELVESEKAIYRAKAEAEGKPEKVLDRIVDGMLDKFFQEWCLMEQPFIKDTDRTIEQLRTDLVGVIGENVEVRRFARFQLGETGSEA